MPSYARGQAEGTRTSIRHGDARVEIERRLADLAFPAGREEVVRAVGDYQVPTAGGKTVRLSEILSDLNADEFTSPRHVSEVARLAWSLPSDVLPPEGGG